MEHSWVIFLMHTSPLKLQIRQVCLDALEDHGSSRIRVSSQAGWNWQNRDFESRPHAKLSRDPQVAYFLVVNSAEFALQGVAPRNFLGVHYVASEAH